MSDNLEALKRLEDCLKPNKSAEENQNMYTQWSMTYDQDHKELNCIGPQVLSDAVGDLFQTNRRTVSVLDIASGTGLVGLELNRLGFKMIDCLEPNLQMMEEARKKGVYRNEFLEGVKENESISINSDTYDVVTCRGGFGSGALPVNSVMEMLRVAKPGGYIIIMIIPECFKRIPSYANTLQPLMDSFEQTGQWTKVKEKHVDNHVHCISGVLLVYKKSKST